MKSNRKSFVLVPIALLALSSAVSAETVVFRSGQTGGVPGTPGSLDDIVTYNPWGNPGGAPVSPLPFTAADFTATAGGPSARVVQTSGAWMGGQVAPLSDPAARWINFDLIPGDYGAGGSALYAVPFWVNTTNITNATLTFEGGADDVLGDWLSGGPNPGGLYINGFDAGYMYQGFNIAAPTTHTQNITSWITPGQNYLYFYQRDIGYALGGIIFSGTIDIVPAPASAGLIGLGGMTMLTRRRSPGA